MSTYLNKEIFDVDNSCIIVAPTGVGKTTALIKHIEDKKEQCIIVSPLNELSFQINEKSSYFKCINSDTSTCIIADITKALSEKKSIIISLKTFSKYKQMFYKFNIYIDECHKLIEYNELCNTEELISDIRNSRFEKVVCITATPLGMDFVLNLPIIKSGIKSPYRKHISLDTISNYKLETILYALHSLYTKHGKLVVMYNNKSECVRLSDELKLFGLKVLNYNSELKEIKIINERFSEDFDILFCTSSLTTGVSIKDDYHAVCILRFFDTINAIPQFFARNRNSYSSGTIIRTYYSDEFPRIPKNIYINSFIGKTGANYSVSEHIKGVLQNLKTYIGKEFLDIWLENDGGYIIENGVNHDGEIILRVDSKFQRVIEDQRVYFINNIDPKFDKNNYRPLKLMYDIYNAISNNNELDTILSSYVKDYTFFKTTDDETVIRADFYDYFYPKIRQYHSDKAKEIASQTTTESIDVSDFEKMFKDKKYVKKEFKEYCMSKFALKKEVFKNKDSINLFLEKIGFQILHKRTGDYIIKIGDSDD